MRTLWVIVSPGCASRRKKLPFGEACEPGATLAATTSPHLGGSEDEATAGVDTTLAGAENDLTVQYASVAQEEGHLPPAQQPANGFLDHRVYPRRAKGASGKIINNTLIKEKNPAVNI